LTFLARDAVMAPPVSTRVRALVFAVSVTALTAPGCIPIPDANSPMAVARARPPRPNPLAGKKLFVDPDSGARRQADAWRTSQPKDAALLDRIAKQPQASWFGEWNGNDVAGAVDRYMTAADDAGAVAMMVVYNIPHRDCGQYSAGGADAAGAYRVWIRYFAQGIRGRPAIVILEPDALGLIDKCLSAEAQAERLALLSDAVGVLTEQAKTFVYLDAGHARWVAADTMASRLSHAGVAGADGFALNTSNYMGTDENIAYGKAISAQIGGKHFVIDTSRNGNGPAADNAWCNPPGRALGAPPTTTTPDPLVDAFLWVKRPGESDGTCNGGPRAGDFWLDGALSLARGGH
jgi:endoglucanase